MRLFKMIPLSVQQRVIALHPGTNELRTAKILTAAMKGNPSIETISEPLQYRAQFDKSDLGVPYIFDVNLVPIDDQGVNWDKYRDQYEASRLQNESPSARESQLAIENDLAIGSCQHQSDSPKLGAGVTLANQIPSQMLYFKILLDKHDYR